MKTNNPNEGGKVPTYGQLGGGWPLDNKRAEQTAQQQLGSIVGTSSSEGVTLLGEAAVSTNQRGRFKFKKKN